MLFSSGAELQFSHYSRNPEYILGWEISGEVMSFAIVYHTGWIVAWRWG